MLLLLACTGRPTVAIVGGGPAGLAAAIEAAPHADVLLYEGEDELGGSARWAMGVTATELPGDGAAARYRDQVESEVLAWTTSLGVTWQPVPDPHGSQELQAPAGGGRALVDALVREAQARGVTLQTGRRIGTLAELPRVDAVIVATGGVMGDVERFRAWAGLPDGELLRGAPTFADGNGWDLIDGALMTEPNYLLYAHGTPGPGDAALMVVAAEGLTTREGELLEGPRGDQGSRWAAEPRERWLDLPETHRVGLLDWQAGQTRPATGSLKLVPTTAKTLSGVTTDEGGRVLGKHGPLPRIYAAGEVSGFGNAYAAGAADSTMVAGAILTGRTAARTALEDL